jgi:DNA-binding transcriptional regulator/RsmH inhibitor MraZ
MVIAMAAEMKVTIKRIDPQGRVVLPLDFRKKIKSGVVFLVERDDKLEVFPGDADLSKYFDSVEADVTSFGDYHALRRELREVYRR